MDGVRHAATVVLLRDGAAGPEVFLIRRHAKSGFFGGAFAFPGGKLDAADSADTALALIGTAAVAHARRTLEDTPGLALTDRTAAGLYVAACRELLEEAGVLLARPAVSHVAAWRAEVARVPELFAAGLRERGLTLAIDELTYWAHWITPSLEPKRYDTRFFVARLPEGCEPAVDDHEATEGRWVPLQAALIAHMSGEIFLPPPTQYIIGELGSAGPTTALITATRRAVVPILPKIAETDTGPAILLPWHASYATAPGEGFAVPGEGLSRFVLAERRWT